MKLHTLKQSYSSYMYIYVVIIFFHVTRRLSTSVIGPGGGGGGGIETSGNRKSNFYVNFEAPEEDQ